MALVTGGARRIGAAICRSLSREGYLVALTYRSSRREARTLAREIGGREYPLDLLRPSGIPRLAASIERRFGRLDALVHNAAVFRRTPAGEVTARAWDGVFGVNVRGPFLLTQALLPLLRATPGSAVLFLGDAGAADLWPGYLPYCLSKLALGHQAAAWRKRLSPGIRVGMVHPGFALAPPGFPEEEWLRLRARRGGRGPDSPAGVADAVLKSIRPEGYNRSVSDHPRRRPAMSKWRCKVCAYVYDPAAGDPENGVPPGTPFEKLPEDWYCPLCGVGKEEFEKV